MQVLKDSAAIRREQLACEISSLLKVHHPNIVQFLGACTREEPLMIVSELMEGVHHANFSVIIGPGSLMVWLHVPSSEYGDEPLHCI